MKKFLFFLMLLCAAGCDWLAEPEGSSAKAPAGESAAWDTTGAYTVEQARSHVGEKKVAVKGYVVGGNLSSSATGISFEGPFTAATNLAIADTLTVASKASCLSVQLPAGAVRDSVNLVDHPDMLGRRVYFLSDIVPAYYGITGLKNVTQVLY